MMTDPPWLNPPARLRDDYPTHDWDLAYQYRDHSVVFRLSRVGVAELFVKLTEAGHLPALAAEAERMRWARSHLPVPSVVRHGTDGHIDWLVTTALPGRDATRAEERADPSVLTRILARGLRTFHGRLPVTECPFDFRLNEAFRLVHKRLRSGLIDPRRDFHDEFANLTATEAVDLLESSRPAVEDLVVCHGDYCLPNIIVEEGQATGFVDLGELGVADRWWDLAVATWSLTWNLGPGFEEPFLEEYGIALDHERLAFYRLLYDLVS